MKKDNKNAISASYLDTYSTWWHGDWDFKHTFKAGESHKIYLEWNHGDPNTPNDWSLTAWGASGGQVTVTHDGGLTTQHLP